MKANIQIISTPTQKSNTSFLLSFDSGNYLFNVGEGTQRLINQTKSKLGKLKAVFHSRMEWEALGGLSGLILTLSDASIEKVDLIGPTKLVDFLAANRTFLWRPQFAVVVTQVEQMEQECFRDENLKISSSALLHKDVSEEDYYQFLKDDQFSAPKKRKMLGKMFSTGYKATNEEMVTDKKTTVLPPASLVYICQGPNVPGKMDGKKVTELGVLPRDRKKLIQGESVTSKFGTIVNPSDCVSDPRPGSVIILVDCPTLSYLDSLINNSHIQSFKNDPKNPPRVVLHNVGADVLNDSQFIQWVKSFPTQTQHIFFSIGLHEHEAVFDSSVQLLELLHQIDPDLFPSEPKLKTLQLPVELQGERFQIGSSRICIDFEPKVDVKTTEVPKSTSIPETVDSVADLVAQFQQEFKGMSVPEYPYVIPLGTASCLPSKHRNVSSNYIRLEQGSVLLDVGEGTLGQLKRHFGDKINQELEMLQLVFISHLHADHHLGAFGVIKEWSKVVGPDKKLFVVAPDSYTQWMNEYAEIENIGLEGITFIRSSSLSIHDLDARHLKESLGLKSIRTVPVLHCFQSFAIVIEDHSFKFGYSGDCRPSEEFIAAGQGCDLLIHEATHEDELRQMALEKNHCTIGEAIDVGVRMNAKNILLTHFSQRYPVNVPVWNLAKGPNIACAFDLMKIRMGDFPKFEKLLPVFNQLLENPS